MLCDFNCVYIYIYIYIYIYMAPRCFLCIKLGYIFIFLPNNGCLIKILSELYVTAGYSTLIFLDF
jgi:hypothetical protein